MRKLHRITISPAREDGKWQTALAIDEGEQSMTIRKTYANRADAIEGLPHFVHVVVPDSPTAAKVPEKKP